MKIYNSVVNKGGSYSETITLYEDRMVYTITDKKRITEITIKYEQISCVMYSPEREEDEPEHVHPVVIEMVGFEKTIKRLDNGKIKTKTKNRPGDVYILYRFENSEELYNTIIEKSNADWFDGYGNLIRWGKSL